MNADGNERSKEAAVLAEIGRVLFPQRLTVPVSLPRELAEQAVSAWRRDDVATTENESEAARQERRRAGSLALIGLAVEERGIPQQDGTVTVDIDAWQVGAALDAADEQGWLRIG